MKRRGEKTRQGEVKRWGEEAVSELSNGGTNLKTILIPRPITHAMKRFALTGKQTLKYAIDVLTRNDVIHACWLSIQPFLDTHVVHVQHLFTVGFIHEEPLDDSVFTLDPHVVTNVEGIALVKEERVWVSWSHARKFGRIGYDVMGRRRGELKRRRRRGRTK